MTIFFKLREAFKFMMSIPHSKPDIDHKDVESVLAVLKSGQLVQGVKVAEFEKKLAKFQGMKGAVAVNSGTSALHLSLLALGIGKGDEVIIPSYVCTALLNAVNYTGASPRMADVSSDDFNIAVASVKKNITKKTKAIIVPHMFGQSADIKALLRLKVPIIEDCAQALGATYGKKKVGSFGVLSIFSFYTTKVMACGEGGMVASNNQRLLDKIKDLRDYDNHPAYKARYNYKMTDMAAALGISQLKKLPAMLSARKAIARKYHQALAGKDVERPNGGDGREHIYFRYVIKVKRHRVKLMAALKEKGIRCAAPVYKPLHRYLKKSGCPVSDQLMKEAISIPIYPALTKAQTAYIMKSFLRVLE